MRLLVLCWMIAASAVYSQKPIAGSSSPPHLYTSVTVRPDDSGSGHSLTAVKGQTITMTNVTLLTCLRAAYAVSLSQVSAPEWMGSTRYDIEAEAASNGSPDFRAILREILTEKFGLIVHHESRDVNVYELSVAKSGPKLIADDSPAVAGGISGARIRQDGATAWGQGITISQFAELLSLHLDRPVVDMTNLNGRFDLKLAWLPSHSRTQEPGTKESSGSQGDLTTVYTAIENQLGLSLTPERDALDVLVVDNARQTPNGY